MNCVEREKKRPDAREPNLLELGVIPLSDVEFVCWENTKHPNYQNNKKYCHNRLGFFIIYPRNHYEFLKDEVNVFLYIQITCRMFISSYVMYRVITITL